MKKSRAKVKDWQKATKKVIPAVVKLDVTTCRTFDTELAGASEATGFVVDKRRGIILTNRHVIGPGPLVAEAVFENHEAIPVYPLYIDPVHDFGFFRFDPAAIKRLSYEEIPLAPKAASVGLGIRVIGNDNGEKISILSGTLACLDREAPQYVWDGYKDFNTFYLQAASGTKCGSSGSPVIDSHGRAVALNAGCMTSGASALYLPLDRVVRALEFLQKQFDHFGSKWQAVTIPRGTLQVVCHASPQSETGMLVVNDVVPGGPAYEKLVPGDVLIRMDGKVISDFQKMETLLDDRVGQDVELEFERSGEHLTVTLMVQDLHLLTPSSFLEISGAVIHDLSYQQALNLGFQCGLVYVSEPGYMFQRAEIPRHAIIRKVDGKSISNIADLINALSMFSRGDRVPLEYTTYVDRYRTKCVLVPLDCQEWYDSPQIYTRDKTSGIWKGKQALCTNSPLLSSFLHQNAIKRLESNNGSNARRVGEDLNFFAESAIEPSLVKLEVHIPLCCILDGVQSPHSSGTGVIIHQSNDMGLVAVEKIIVPVSACEVMISFAALPDIIPGEVVFMHPVHNYAIVSYDPARLGTNGASVVRAAELLPEPALRHGESVYLVWLNSSLRATSRKSVVTDTCVAPECSSIGSPRYRATNMEFIKLDTAHTAIGSKITGVLANENGSVKAILGSFSTWNESDQEHQFVKCIPIHSLSQVLKEILSGAKGPHFLINGIRRRMPELRILEVELYPILLSEARRLGLSENWIQDFEPVRQVLQVQCCLAGSKAENVLEQGDMVLEINKKLVTCFKDVDDACHLDGLLKMTIWRKGRKVELQVETDLRYGNGTTHAISWCGCLVQYPHAEVRALGFLPQKGHGVYITRRYEGSPTEGSELDVNQWIVEVNGKPTNNLDAFLNVIKEIKDEEFVRVKTVKLDGDTKVVIVKHNLNYFPTWELKLDLETARWRRKTIKSIDLNEAKSIEDLLTKEDSGLGSS